MGEGPDPGTAPGSIWYSMGHGASRLRDLHGVASTPTYVFEWGNGKVVEAFCSACGNEDPSAFLSEEELEEMVAAEDEDEE